MIRRRLMVALAGLLGVFGLLMVPAASGASSKGDSSAQHSKGEKDKGDKGKGDKGEHGDKGDHDDEEHGDHDDHDHGPRCDPQPDHGNGPKEGKGKKCASP
ncbi:MAG: hypothetical protein QOK43_25 [Acidimicrobiaceae bacterium]|nr:hypothetical protein [Acidimicrobiaceae bacterium]